MQAVLLQSLHDEKDSFYSTYHVTFLGVDSSWEQMRLDKRRPDQARYNKSM